MLTAMDQIPSIAEVDRIAALDDPVLRNLQITQCYHELSSALAQRLPGEANWCTFATWASKQAGGTIRKEDLARAWEDLLTAPSTAQAAGSAAAAAQGIGAQGSPQEILRLAWEAINPYAALERASAAVGRGNQKVFAEIGREFARYVAACLGDVTFDGESIAGFCAALHPGDPPDGQRYLSQAFTRYYQAAFEPDPKARAELVLLASLEMGFHEQTRLQPEIAAALDAILFDPRSIELRLAERRLILALFPGRGIQVYAGVLFRRLLGRPDRLEEVIDRLIALARGQLRTLLTEHMLALDFPGGLRLRLGDDLHAIYPAALEQIANPELCALLAQIDPTPDSLRETGAVDWADLPDRLHFIADLFRCYQEWPEMQEPPYTPEQVTEIKAGRLPKGPL
jgi:hypothetical protein